jgi:hypothetical protein
MLSCRQGAHFQDKPEKPTDCWPWLLPPADPGCCGLTGPPEDSLRLMVPLDSGLLGPIVPPIRVVFGGADEGSDGASCCCFFFGSFFPSVLKLPTTICNNNIGDQSLV